MFWNSLNYFALDQKGTQYVRVLEDLVTSFVGIPLCPQKDIVVVAGGSRGIGSHLVTMFDSLGYKTILIDKRYPLNLIEPHRVSFYKCDISDFEYTRLILDDISVRFGQITVFINAVSLKSFTDAEVGKGVSLRKLMRTVYAGSMHIIQHILPKMIAYDRGYIIDIASTEGLYTTENKSSYGAIQATKFQLLQLIEQTLKEQYKKNFLISNGRVRCLLLIFGKALNSKRHQDMTTAKTVFSAIFHNRQGVQGYSMRTNFKLALRELDWQWYQMFKYLSPFL